nr:hypothetical protein [Eubacterium sp.]
MTKRFQRMCARVCSVLMIPMLVASPMDAAQVQSTSVKNIATANAESTPVESALPAVTPEASITPLATPLVTPESSMAPTPSADPMATADPSASINPSATPLPTPTPVPSFKSAIPDETFRKVVNELVFGGLAQDTDILSDGMLTQIAAYTGKIDVRGMGIVNLKGIEYFTGITELDCAHNNLQLLDLSTLTNLKTIDTSYNDLTELTVGKDNVLEVIDCSDNNLTALNLASMTTVLSLDCSNNDISNLNVSGLYQLKTMDCSDNALPSLAVEGLVALEELYADGNAIVNLNVSTLKELKVLECRKSELTLPVQAIGESYCGVVLPEGATKPSNISDSGAYDEATRGIVWDKVKGVPAKITYTYEITGKKQNVTVTINTDKTNFVEKAVSVGGVGTITAKSTGYNKVKISWNGADGASGYRVYRSTSKNGTFTKIKSVTSSSKVSYTNSGISCGTTYYYKVRAYRLIDGNYYFGEYSNVVSGKAVPAAPGGVSVSKASKKYVKVSWNKVSGADGYRVYRSTSKTSGFSKIKTVKSGSTISCKKKTTRYKKYYYKVRAYKTVNGKKVWGAYSSVKGKTLK